MKAATDSPFTHVRLATVATVVRGSSPRPAGDPRFFNGSFLPWITVADVTKSDDPTLCSTYSQLTEEGAERTRIFEPGTVLLTNSGATLGVPKICGIRAGANDGIAGFLDLSPKLDPHFLYYCLSALTDHLRNKVASGVGQPNLNTELIGDVHVPIPALEEQARIVQVLATWDCGIRQLSDLIAAKLRFKQGLMQKVLTGKRRFPEFDKPWLECGLGDLFDEREETNRTDLPLLSITADRGVIPRQDIERKDTSSEDKSLYKRISPGDIGYNTMRMWQGVSALSGLEGIVSPAYTICIPRQSIDAEFAAHLFKYPPVVHQFYRHSQGLVDDTLSLKFHHFGQVRVRIPCIKEQRQVVAVLRETDNEMAILRRELEALKTQKKGLLKKLISGNLRVRDSI